MKKNIILASVLLASVLSITSCTHDDVVNEQSTQQEVIPQKSEVFPITAKTFWTYLPNQSWSFVAGTATGWVSCYDAKGTNQNSNRAVFTVTNNSTSPSFVTLRIQVTSSTCPNNPGQEVEILEVPKGMTLTKHVIVANWAASETRLRAEIRPASTSGSYSGTILYGYEQ